MSKPELDSLRARQPPSSFDVLEIWTSISNSWKTFNRDTERALKPTGLSLAEVRILYTLYEYGPLPITKLTGELLVTPGAITSIVDCLESRKELVERVRIEDDRRIVTIKITSKGEAELKKALVLHKQYIMKRFEALSKKQIILLAELMDKLSKSPV